MEAGMHGLAAFVMTIAINLTKPRIQGGIKAIFGKSLFMGERLPTGSI
jgi:hypothetical protein